MSATFDATTTSEYATATTAAQRSALIVAALTGTVSVKVFNGSNVEMGSGTMAAPWATSSGATVTVGEVTSFTVGTTATPDSNWYIRFQNADVSRWVRGSFGLSSSSQDFTWSLSSWTAGQAGTIGTATITTTGNSAPVFTVAPTAASIAATGGSIQFTATDADGQEVTYSLVARTGFTINSTTGLVTVTSATAGTSGNITVTASDGVLSTSATCAVEVANANEEKRWNPSHGIKASADIGESLAATISSTQNWFQYLDNSDYFGFVLTPIRWGRMNTTGSTYDWTLMDSHLALLRSTYPGKRIVPILEYKAFNASNAYCAPLDLMDQVYSKTATAHAAAVWRSAVMDRYIAYVNAFLNRYDSEPLVEMVTWSETALGAFGAVAGAEDFSQAALATQLKRLYTGISASSRLMFVGAAMNSLVNQLGGATGLMESAYQAGLGLTSPDTQDEAANTIFTGVTSGAEIPVRDYRGRMSNLQTASSPAISDSNPAAIINWAQTHGVTHLPWYPAHSTYGISVIVAAINADPSLHTAYPTG